MGACSVSTIMYFGSLITFSSNVFLAIVQGKLGALQGEISPNADGADVAVNQKRGPSSGLTIGLSTTIDRVARSLAPLIAAASLSTKMSIPSSLFRIIGHLDLGSTSLPPSRTS